MIGNALAQYSLGYLSGENDIKTAYKGYFGVKSSNLTITKQKKQFHQPEP